MTHQEQIIAMLDEAKVDYGYTDGDSIIANGCRLRFQIDGRLSEIYAEGGAADEWEY